MTLDNLLTLTNLYIVLSNIFLAIIFFLILKKNYFLSILYVLIIGFIFYKLPNIQTLLIFVLPNVIIGFIFHFLTPHRVVEDSTYDVLIPTDNGKEFLFENIKRGVCIFGSAGSGKTESPIYYLFKHFQKHNYAGVFFDFKNGELTEIAQGIFDDVVNINLDNPRESNRINFIDPKYLGDEIEISQIVEVLINNLIDAKGQTGFFLDTAKGTLVALILKFKLDHPEYCTLPHIIAFLTSTDFSGLEVIERNDENGNSVDYSFYSQFKKLKEFLESNQRVSTQASALLSSINNNKQTSAVISSLINSIVKISSPKLFWIFSKSEIDFDINSDENRKIVSIISRPSKNKALKPLIACSIQTFINNMMERDRKQSFLLLDEAPTIKIDDMAQVPATMRSFNIITVYCAQDVIQGYVQYGRDGFREITANLAIQVFGKPNDPDTAKFFESYTEDVEVESVSVNKSTGGFYDKTSSKNISKRQQKKIRQSEFLQLVTGEFVVIVNGISDKIKYAYPNIVRQKSLIRNKISESELEQNFEKIFQDIKNLTN